MSWNHKTISCLQLANIVWILVKLVWNLHRVLLCTVCLFYCLSMILSGNWLVVVIIISPYACSVLTSLSSQQQKDPSFPPHAWRPALYQPPPWREKARYRDDNGRFYMDKWPHERNKEIKEVKSPSVRNTWLHNLKDNEMEHVHGSFWWEPFYLLSDSKPISWCYFDIEFQSYLEIMKENRLLQI